jgi:tetratricopeptide (TPR) repeat protein
VILATLGWILALRGAYHEGEEQYQEALANVKATVGERHPDYATALNNLASLRQTTGDLLGAQKLYAHATELVAATLGDKHAFYATELNNQGLVAAGLGRYDDA